MMMKLRMSVGRCCCGPMDMDLVHWLFCSAQFSRNVRLHLKSESGNPDPPWDPFVVSCVSSELILYDPNVSSHGEHGSGPGIGVQAWCIRMTGGAHDSRSCYLFTVTLIRKVTPINNTATWDFSFDLLSKDDTTQGAAYGNVASIHHIASSSDSDLFLMNGYDWLDDGGRHGSLWIVGDDQEMKTAGRSILHWDGQMTPELIAAGGGTEDGARMRFRNVREGWVSTQKNYSSNTGVTVGLLVQQESHSNKTGTEVYVVSNDVWLKTNATAASGSNSAWFSVLTDLILGAWTTGGGSSLSELPVRQLDYNSITINDGTHGNLVPCTKQNYVVSAADVDDFFRAGIGRGCVDVNGTHFFTVVVLNKESTLPPSSQDHQGGLVTMLVLIKVDLATMGISNYAILQIADPIPATPPKSRSWLGWDAEGIGTMKATPAGGVMFNQDEFDYTVSPLSLGFDCFDSSCNLLWHLASDAAGYVTYNGDIYFNGHPDATSDPAKNPQDPSQVSRLDPNTGAIVKEFSGEIPNALMIESIEGPIHLR